MKNLLRNPEILNEIQINKEIVNNTISQEFNVDVMHIFDLVNRSKNIGRLDLANKFFSLLFDYMKKYWETDLYFEIEKSYRNKDAYYDILVVYAINEAGQLSNTNACIPIPLLDREHLEIVMHTGFDFVDRDDRPHNRVVEYNSEEEQFLQKKYKRFFKKDGEIRHQKDFYLNLNNNDTFTVLDQLNEIVIRNSNEFEKAAKRLGLKIEKCPWGRWEKIYINNTIIKYLGGIEYIENNYSLKLDYLNLYRSEGKDCQPPTLNQLNNIISDIQEIIDASYFGEITRQYLQIKEDNISL